MTREGVLGGALFIVTVWAVAACASAGSGGPGRSPGAPGAAAKPVVNRVQIVGGESFSPERGAAAVRAFVTDVAATDSGGECGIFKLGGLSAAVTASAAFPSRAASKTTVALTFDTAGHLARYSEVRGFTGLHGIPPGTTNAVRDSSRLAAIAATRTTSISFDYTIDQAIVRNHGGGKPDQSVLATPREFESLERLGPISARLVRVRKLCGV